MFRLVIIFISILWASLLLISWSGATPVSQIQAPVTTTSTAS